MPDKLIFPINWAKKVATEGRFYREAKPVTKRPTIVCLCGSSRFKADFDDANLHETMAGKIVLTITPHIIDRRKAARMHRKKIDLADEILVIAPGGYVGPSTKFEIAYARKKWKPVRYWQF